ncbi:hypothetical protein PUNSTDRAFT_36326, partial [Punctularia strigosozonata HHB-11173 SS5]|uniref:uncharacterized protein n=1 Tax=Punctularia strigosozonata (strain HHB-11173) TaxID=741275 RepID=UPI0004417891
RDYSYHSMIAGAYWNGMSDEEKAPFERLAEIAKEEHARLYPNYKYAPAAPGQKKRKGSRTSKAERERCK